LYVLQQQILQRFGGFNLILSITCYNL